MFSRLLFVWKCHCRAWQTQIQPSNCNKWSELSAASRKRPKHCTNGRVNLPQGCFCTGLSPNNLPAGYNDHEHMLNDWILICFFVKDRKMVQKSLHLLTLILLLNFALYYIICHNLNLLRIIKNQPINLHAPFLHLFSHFFLLRESLCPACFLSPLAQRWWKALVVSITLPCRVLNTGHKPSSVWLFLCRWLFSHCFSGVEAVCVFVVTRCYLGLWAAERC